MQLYFGPNFRYFSDDGKGNFKYRAPPNFLDLFRTVRMRSIEHVAFGEGDSFFTSYTRLDGQHLYHFQHDDRYPSLKSWLFDEDLDHGNTAYVSLGTGNAFFAASKQGHRWRNIPEDACDYYQKFTRPDLFATKRVNTIDLGHNNTFLGISVDSTWFWDLGNEFPSLQKLDLVANLPKAKWVMISPFAADQHFVVFEDGSVHYAFPPQWASDVANLMQEYAAAQAQKVQKTNRWTKYSDHGLSVSQTGASYSAQSTRYQQPEQKQGTSFDVNEGMHLANNVLDMYNNTTNAGGQSGGSSFDVNQAMGVMQSSLNNINTASGYGRQGLNMVNQLTNTGLMVGQVAGAAAGCNVM